MTTDIEQIMSDDVHADPADDARTAKRRDLRESCVILLPMAIAGALFAGLLLCDQLGPTTDRRATITSTYIERTGRNGRDTSHIAAGVDELGGTFELNLPVEEWDRVHVDEDIVVSRAMLTGRVVDVDETDGWDVNTTTRVAVLSSAFGVALAVVIATIVGISRLRVPQTARRRTYERLWFLATAVAAAAGFTIFIASERSEAQPARCATTDLASTLPTTGAGAAGNC